MFTQKLGLALLFSFLVWLGATMFLYGLEIWFSLIPANTAFWFVFCFLKRELLSSCTRYCFLSKA